MHSRGQLYIETLFERLQPNPGHAIARIDFAASQCLQNLVGRARNVNHFYLDIVFGEQAEVLCDGRPHGAYRVGVPHHFDFTRHGSRRDQGCVRRHPANRRVLQQIL